MVPFLLPFWIKLHLRSALMQRTGRISGSLTSSFQIVDAYISNSDTGRRRSRKPAGLYCAKNLANTSEQYAVTLLNQIEPTAHEARNQVALGWCNGVLGLLATHPDRPDRYRYDPFAPDNYRQRHGRLPTPTMTAVGMLMRMYSGWKRDNPAMQSAADFLLQYPPRLGTQGWTKRDGYYWYYATQVMFHMGGDHWKKWNQHLNPLLLRGQIKSGPKAGSWDARKPVPDRWAPHAGLRRNG